MYVTLFNEDINSHILTMNFLRAQNIEFIMKGHYFFLRTDTYERAKKEYRDICLQNFESADPEVKYHLLANQVEVTAKNISHIFEGYISQDFIPEESFVMPQSRVIFYCGFIGLYFKSSLIANPLDVLWKIAATWSFRQKYKAVFYDFITTKHEIFYAVFFKFTGQDFTAKINEILMTKNAISKEPLTLAGSNGFPQIYKDFQSRYLTNAATVSVCPLEFVDTVVYLPTTEDQVNRVRKLFLDARGR